MSAQESTPSSSAGDVDGALDARLSQALLWPQHEHLRPYIPKHVDGRIVEFLMADEAVRDPHDKDITHPEALIDILASHTHSPPDSSLHVRVVNNLIIIFQAFLFFAEFIKMDPPDEHGIRMSKIHWTKALDVIMGELNLWAVFPPITAIPATCLLSLMDSYAIQHEFFILNCDPHTFYLGFDQRTEFLGSMMYKWHQFRIDQVICHVQWSLCDETYDKRLASRILQWREYMPAQKALLFLVLPVPFRRVERRVMDGDQDATVAALTSHDAMGLHLTADPGFFPLPPFRFAYLEVHGAGLSQEKRQRLEMWARAYYYAHVAYGEGWRGGRNTGTAVEQLTLALRALNNSLLG